MFVYINDKKFEAKTGERLIDIARNNHTHIGYFCGGNGICQTCYVKVTEGMHLLSPLNDREKAMLSDSLIKEGIRVACLTTLDKLGTVKLLTTVEEVKKTFEEKPLELVPYQAKMGWESLIKFPETIVMQARRFSEGKLDAWQLVTDIAGAIAGAFELVGMAIQGTLDWKVKPKTFTREYADTSEHRSNGKKGQTAEGAHKTSPEIHESLKLQKHAPVN
ncbi:ferredoxin [Prosthecochloris marina]|uniref:Ferredoxin n=1 Tax=Prosthecochloris marina TaxID=2017681 RepID=A0A317T6J2_9CHLB|nr:2Fe-2S iron-sulfur cluster-binding protein [Prosthecochloris marina]PWW81357.1 ferredoxin [Prosthecochloris marina]